jgi:hypothetical protein
MIFGSIFSIWSSLKSNQEATEFRGWFHQISPYFTGHLLNHHLNNDLTAMWPPWLLLNYEDLSNFIPSHYISGIWSVASWYPHGEATWRHCRHPRTRRSELQDAPRAHSVTPAEDQRVLAREAAGFGPEVAPICSNSAGNLDFGGDGVVGLGLVTGSK